jgi:HSP20 family molecular chaperone IbpA
MMSDLLARRQPRRLPEPTELFADFATWADIPLLVDTQLMRLEDEMEDGHYVVRAEIPGIDPAKDVDITVRDGQLTIKAERSEKTQAEGRSEFRYGSFARYVTLPAGANEDDIKATYDKGILTVSVAVPEQAAPAEKHIAVRTANQAGPKRHRWHSRHSR